MADVFIKQGDTSPAIVRTLEDGDGAPVNLEDATVRFVMRAIHGDYLDLAGDTTILQAEEGEDLGLVSYTWAEGDTETPGGYHGEFEVTFDNESIETFPNGGNISVAILRDLDEHEEAS